MFNNIYKYETQISLVLIFKVLVLNTKIVFNTKL